MADDVVYRRIESSPDRMERPLKERGPVLYWEGEGQQSCVFVCACGQREVYLAKHDLSLDEQGVLTVKQSVLTRWHNEEYGDKICHFWLKNGQIKMVNDSTCAGAQTDG